MNTNNTEWLIFVHPEVEQTLTDAMKAEFTKNFPNWEIAKLTQMDLDMIKVMFGPGSTDSEFWDKNNIYAVKKEAFEPLDFTITPDGGPDIHTETDPNPIKDGPVLEEHDNVVSLDNYRQEKDKAFFENLLETAKDIWRGYFPK